MASGQPRCAPASPSAHLAFLTPLQVYLDPKNMHSKTSDYNIQSQSVQETLRGYTSYL